MTMRTSPWSAVTIIVLVALCAWPVLIGVATALGMYNGEAWQLDAWSQEPKARLLGAVLDGWKQAAPWSLAIGVLAALDRAVLGSLRFTAPMIGITLPIAAAALAFRFWAEPAVALPTLLLCGLLLGIIARLIHIAGRRTT